MRLGRGEFSWDCALCPLAGAEGTQPGWSGQHRGRPWHQRLAGSGEGNPWELRLQKPMGRPGSRRDPQQRGRCLGLAPGALVVKKGRDGGRGFSFLAGPVLPSPLEQDRGRVS